MVGGNSGKGTVQLSMVARMDFEFVIPSAKRKILLPQNIHIFAEFLSNTF